MRLGIAVVLFGLFLSPVARSDGARDCGAPEDFTGMIKAHDAALDLGYSNASTIFNIYWLAERAKKCGWDLSKYIFVNGAPYLQAVGRAEGFTIFAKYYGDAYLGLITIAVDDPSQSYKEGELLKGRFFRLMRLQPYKKANGFEATIAAFEPLH